MLMFRPEPASTSAQDAKSVMLIRGGFNLAYDFLDYTPMILTINIRPERVQDLMGPESVTLFPEIPHTNFIDQFGNNCTRLIAPPGRLSIWNRFVIADSGLPEELPIYAYQHQVGELPEDTLGYLLGSRYCDTDKLSGLAWSLFGGYRRGWPLVQAIMDYTHDQLVFNYGMARPDRTAFDAHEARTGVCRDYAHLAISLFRCMNIPARYCTGYPGRHRGPSRPVADGL
jgi:transglutaminase-like putative cysteine protease